ncbi:hypothetical protein Ddye_017000 [Dipteronia dyeriana]|uniref:Uncharacterized protein n=1 Tax=Dipteronia dyeriana TaxID=168575 RepID=A0AAD9U7T2_9ROSI|nr:hypothetical protein Ddye_017000 [Dipteronia dyeriana]
MELRSRKNIGKSPESGGNEQGEADSKQHDGDDEIYLPSSDSDISSSSHECEIYVEKEVVDSNPRAKLKLSAGGREIGGSVVTLNDHAEPSAKRGRLEHAEQFNNEQQSVPLQGNNINNSWSNRRRKVEVRGKERGILLCCGKFGRMRMRNGLMSI